jgi:hypothetical protein
MSGSPHFPLRQKQRFTVSRRCPACRHARSFDVAVAGSGFRLSPEANGGARTDAQRVARVRLVRKSRGVVVGLEGLGLRKALLAERSGSGRLHRWERDVVPESFELGDGSSPPPTQTASGLIDQQRSGLTVPFLGSSSAARSGVGKTLCSCHRA